MTEATVPPSPSPAVIRRAILGCGLGTAAVFSLVAFLLYGEAGFDALQQVIKQVFNVWSWASFAFWRVFLLLGITSSVLLMCMAWKMGTTRTLPASWEKSKWHGHLENLLLMCIVGIGVVVVGVTINQVALNETKRIIDNMYDVRVPEWAAGRGLVEVASSDETTMTLAVKARYGRCRSIANTTETWGMPWYQWTLTTINGQPVDGKEDASGLCHVFDENTIEIKGLRLRQSRIVHATRIGDVLTRSVTDLHFLPLAETDVLGEAIFIRSGMTPESAPWYDTGSLTQGRCLVLLDHVATNPTWPAQWVVSQVNGDPGKTANLCGLADDNVVRFEQVVSKG